jgi:hypothetical protein
MMDDGFMKVPTTNHKQQTINKNIFLKINLSTYTFEAK